MRKTIMNITIVSKVKLNTNKDVNDSFAKTANAFTESCNYVSKHAFTTDNMLNQYALRGDTYDSLRREHGLKSQMACSVPKCVVAKYKTLKDQMNRKPFAMKENGEMYYCRRNLDWVTKPIEFKKPFVELVRGRDYSLCKEGLSINTLDGRVKVSYKSHNMEKLLDDGWRMGTAKLFCRKGKWFLHIAFTKEFEDIDDFDKVVGIDRGLRFVMTTYDGEKTGFYDGKAIAKKREEYARTRASLQKKGTKGARRTLKRISGRENRWMNDVNHCLSKALANKPNTLFVIEDLTDITTDKKNRNKKQRRELRNWTFYDLEKKLTYKARMNGSDVIKVPPRYTSQRCPICGHTEKENRDRSKHEFRCKSCEYRSNDDRIGAMNIRELGIRYLQTGKLQGFPRH